MKKNLIFITGSILIIVVCFLVHSCKKQSDTTYNNNSTEVPDNLLQAAKNWEVANTQNLATAATSTSQGTSGSRMGSTALSLKATYVLTPNWNDAKLQHLSNGQTQIVVASPDYPLSTKSKWSAVRKFVYNVDQNKVTGGTIIEMFSTPGYMGTHKNNLIENYTDNKLKNFTGAAIRYDLNYHRLMGDVYNHGVKLKALTKLKTDNGQHLKVGNNLFTPLHFRTEIVGMFTS